MYCPTLNRIQHLDGCSKTTPCTEMMRRFRLFGTHLLPLGRICSFTARLGLLAPHSKHYCDLLFLEADSFNSQVTRT